MKLRHLIIALLCTTPCIGVAFASSTTRLLPITQVEFLQWAEQDLPLIYLQNPQGDLLPLTYQNLSPYLTIQQSDEYTELSLELSEEQAQSLVSSQESFFENAGNITITPKQDALYQIEGSAVANYQLFTTLLTELLADALVSTHRSIVTLPVQNLDPTVFLDGKQLDIVAHGVSDFSGSSTSRIHNIQTAMNRFNGYVIKQGETFSFNNQLGEVDASTGYHKELVIKGDRTIPEYGGGVCQVSSTVYRAAMDGGLPIDERKGHSYAVNHYKPWGTDATIYLGVVDLKFTNDTPSDIIIHLEMQGDLLHTLFYGESDGRIVELSGPNVYGHTATPPPIIDMVDYLAPGQQVVKQYGQGGFASWWTRTITYADGRKEEEKITTVYEGKRGLVLEGANKEIPHEEDSVVTP